MSPRLKELTVRAEALSPGTEGVKELVRDITTLPCVYKQRLYSAIAYSTGLTHGEISALASEVRLENRGVN